MSCIQHAPAISQYHFQWPVEWAVYPFKGNVETVAEEFAERSDALFHSLRLRLIILHGFIQINIPNIADAGFIAWVRT